MNVIDPLAQGFFVGLIVAGASLAAMYLRMLTPYGVAAAVIVGTVTYIFGGLPFTGLLIVFFATSSLLTRVQADRKSHPEHQRGRSASQVLANGAAAALSAIWYGINPSPLALFAFAGAVAASTADTWATEIGLLSPATPRLITTWQRVPRGTSGAVTLLGTIGGIVGACVIAFTAAHLMGTSTFAVFVAGAIAMLVDSLLGATTEGRVVWMNNNTINLIISAVGSISSIIFA